MQPVIAPAQHLGVLTDFDPVTASGQMSTQGSGGLSVGSFGVGTVAHFQQPHQVLTGSEARVHPRLHIRGWVGVGPILFFQLGLPGEQLGQARQLFVELRLVCANRSFCPRDLRLQAGQAFAPTLQIFLQKYPSFSRNRAFLHLLGVIDLAEERLAGLPQAADFGLLLIQPATRASHTCLLRFDALLDQFGSPPRPDMSLRLSRLYQFFQALGRDGVSGMVKAGQPQSFSLDSRQTDPRQLISQLHAVIHPTECGLRVVGAGGTHGLAGEIEIEYDRCPSPQQVMYCSCNERLAEFIDDFFYRSYRFLVAGLQRPTHPAVVGKARLTPGAHHRTIFRHGLRSVIEVLQTFYPTHDPSQKFYQLGLGGELTRLLPNRHLHHLINQPVLFQKFSKGDQHAVRRVDLRPVRRSSCHSRFLRSRRGYPLSTAPCKIESDSTIRRPVAQNLR